MKPLKLPIMKKTANVPKAVSDNRKSVNAYTANFPKITKGKAVQAPGEPRSPLSTASVDAYKERFKELTDKKAAPPPGKQPSPSVE
jgi:hypothetical protein